MSFPHAARMNPVNYTPSQGYSTRSQIVRQRESSSHIITGDHRRGDSYGPYSYRAGSGAEVRLGLLRRLDHLRHSRPFQRCSLHLGLVDTPWMLRAFARNTPARAWTKPTWTMTLLSSSTGGSRTPSRRTSTSRTP